VCTVLASWWWTENLSETCRVLFQKQNWEINASGWFYCKNYKKMCHFTDWFVWVTQEKYIPCYIPDTAWKQKFWKHSNIKPENITYPLVFKFLKIEDCIQCAAKYFITTYNLKTTYLLTYLLTPWCRVLLEKLTGLQLVKKFPTFHGTRRFITTLTSVRHLSLS